MKVKLDRRVQRPLEHLWKPFRLQADHRFADQLDSRGDSLRWHWDQSALHRLRFGNGAERAQQPRLLYYGIFRAVAARLRQLRQHRSLLRPRLTPGPFFAPKPTATALVVLMHWESPPLCLPGIAPSLRKYGSST